jgi:hypothetical protein
MFNQKGLLRHPVAVRALLFHLYPSIGQHLGQVKTTIIAWETSTIET